MGPIAGQIGEAFVRIRPNTAGFKGETESGVKSALVSVGKITAGFFAVKGLTDEFKHIADSAAEHQAAFAVLDRTIKNAGASTRVFGTDIEHLLEKEAKLKGFTDEDLASGFTRLVSVTKDTGKAFHALSLAEDVSRARHIDVQTASLALSRALQGSTISLSRLGIIIPKVNTEQAKLRIEHDRLAASGVKFTGSVKEIYQAQLTAAKASDEQGSRLNALQVVQDRFGGSAKAFAENAAGRFQKFDVSLHLLEISLGKLLLPTLSEVTTALTGWLDQLRESESVQHTAASAVQFVRGTFQELRATVEFLAPALRPVVSLLADLARFSGFGGILVAVGAFKALGPAIDIASAARRKYVSFTAAVDAEVQRATLAQRGEAEALGTSIPLLDRHAAATQGDAAASARAAIVTGEWTNSLRANAAALAENTALAARQGEAAVASAAATTFRPLPGSASTKGVTLIEASTASQGAEALRELSASASDASSSVLDSANSVGTLASDLDHASNVATKTVTRTRAVGVASREAAAGTQALATSGAAGAAASLKSAETLAGETVAVERLTAAETALIGARVSGTAAAGAEALATEGAAVSKSAAAATEGVATSATRVGAVLRTLGRSLFSFVGGWPVVAAAAVGGLSFGIYKLVTAESSLDRANDRLRTSLLGVGEDLRRVRAAATAYGNALSNLKTDRLQVAEAQLGIQRAETALTTSKAARGSLEYQQLTQDLAGAQDALRLAERRVADDEKTAADARRQRTSALISGEHDRQEALRKTLDLLEQIAGTEPKTLTVQKAFGEKIDTHDLESSSRTLRILSEKLHEDAQAAAKKNQPFISQQAEDLSRLFRTLSKTPETASLVPIRRIIEEFYKSTRTSGRAAYETLVISQQKTAASSRQLVAQLARERGALAGTDRPLAARLGIVENLVRATGRRLKPQLVEFIFRSNVEAGIRRMISVLDSAGVSLRTFATTLAAEARLLGESNPALARRLIILNQFSALVGRLPTHHETDVVLKAPTALGAVAALQIELGKMDGAARAHGAESGEAWARQFFTGLTKIPFLNDAFKGLTDDTAKAAAAAANDALEKAAEAQLKGQLATAKQVVDTARQGVESARQSLADARRSVLDAQQALADAITQGNQQITDSLNSAGSNLVSIGQSLSDSISKFFDAQSAKGQQAPTGPLAARLKELEKLINEGKGTPAIIAKAQEVEAELNAQSAKGAGTGADKRKERVQRRLADLTDEFNTGKISLARFNREVTALLRKENINYKNAGRVLGVAFADGFRAQLLGLREQAGAIAKFGKRPGLGAFGVNVERPAEVRSKVQEQIARDQESLTRAQGTILKDIRTVSAKERTLAAAEQKAGKIRDQLTTVNKHMASTAAGISTLVKQNAQILKLAKERAGNTAVLPGGKGLTGTVINAGAAALLRPQIEQGLSAASGSASARRAGRQLVREFTALGGQLGDGITAGLRRGERRFFQQLDDLLLGGHAHARKTARAQSPSLLFAEFGDELVSGLILGIGRSTPRLADASQALVGAARPANIRQSVRIERAFRVAGNLRDFLRRQVPGTPAPVTARQLVRVERNFSLRETLASLLGRATVPSRLRDALVSQRVELRRSLVRRELRFPTVPSRIADAVARQAVSLRRSITTDQPPFPAVPTRLRTAAVAQGITLRRELAVTQPRFPLVPARLRESVIRHHLRLLRDLTVNEPNFPPVTARLRDAVTRQGISLLRSLKVDQRPFPAVPRTLLDATAHQRVELRRSLAVSQPPFPLVPPRLRDVAVSQGVTLRRGLTVRATPFPVVPPRLRDASVRQEVNLRRVLNASEIRFPTVATRLRDALISQRVSLRRGLTVTEPRIPSVTSRLRDAVTRQRIDLRRELVSRPPSFPSVPGRIRAAIVAQGVALRRSLAVSQPPFPAVPQRLRDAVVRHHVSLRRDLAVSEPPFPSVRASLRDAIVRQGVYLRRTLAVAQAPFPVVPARLQEAAVRQSIRLRRDLSVNEPRIPTVPARLRDASVRQAISLRRDLNVRTPPIPPVPGRLPGGLIRQALSLVRSLSGGNFRALIARAQQEVPPSLAARTVRQRIDLSRKLAERETTRQILSRAEQVGSLAHGRASVTVLVGANVRPARAALDQLRRATERSAILPVRAAQRSAAQGLVRAATPRVGRAAPVVPRIATRGIEPLREAIANRQRGTLIGEERRQTRILEKIFVEERKQTGLLRSGLGPRERPAPGKKNPRKATQEATATAIHNLLGS